MANVLSGGILPGDPLLGGVLGGAIFGKKKHDQTPGNLAWQKYYDRLHNQDLLSQEEKDYEKIPDTLKQSYTGAAQRAGTYSDTPQFKSELDSEVQAGTRGARIESVARQNALRTALGMSALSDPSVVDPSTQGAATQQALTTGTGLPNPDPTGPIAPAANATAINQGTSGIPDPLASASIQSAGATSLGGNNAVVNAQNKPAPNMQRRGAIGKRL
jgi:hypothetical protein